MDIGLRTGRQCAYLNTDGCATRVP